MVPVGLLEVLQALDLEDEENGKTDDSDDKATAGGHNADAGLQPAGPT